jgi:tyrosine-protein kinase
VSEDLSLVRHLRTLRRGAWLIALCLAGGLVSAAIFVSTQHSVYRASMKVVIGQGGGIFQPADAGAVDPLAQTMTNLLQSDIVARRVITKLNLSLTPREFLDRLAVSTKPQTAVLSVRYDSGDKAQAVAILRETGDVFTTLVRQRLGGQNRSRSPVGAPTIPVSASIFDPAHLEPGRISPRPLRTIALAGALALLIGVGLVLARESLKPRIDGRDQAEESFGAPVVGTLPEKAGRTPPLGLSARQGRADEQVVRGLAPLAGWLEAMHSARQGRADEQLVRALAPLIGWLEAMDATSDRVIVVTSAVDNEGKSVLVAHLGAALAAAGEEVICVEADGRIPTVSTYLGVQANSEGPESYGLLDVVDRRVELEDALHPVRAIPTATSNGYADAAGKAHGSRLADSPQERHGLRLLPAGRPRSSAAALLTSEVLISLTTTLSSLSRYVIVDAPPLLHSPHALSLATASDTILVAAREGSTTKANAEAVRKILAAVERTRTGVVLCQPRSTRRRLLLRGRAGSKVHTTRLTEVTETPSSVESAARSKT